MSYPHLPFQKTQTIMKPLALWLISALGFGLAASPAWVGPAIAQEDVSESVSESVDVVTLCGEAALNLTTELATLPADQAAKLDDLLRQMVTTAGTAAAGILPSPGLVLWVETPTGGYWRAVGVADVDSCEPLQPTAPFQIGSNTKMMTALIIFQLQEEGVLSIDDPLSDWLPDIASRLPYGDEIIIAQLLTHTSGLWDYVDGTPGEQDGLFWQGMADPQLFTQDFTPQELIDYAIANGTPNYAPGTPGSWLEPTGGWSYTNTGYVLLGMIIETATGQTLEANYRSRVWDEAGMTQTYLQTGVPTPEERAQLPHGYLAPPFDQDTSEFNLSQAWAAGAVVSTAPDMARFVQRLFENDYFTQPGTLSQMLTPSPSTTGWTADYFYGYGVFVKAGLLGHGGQTLAFESDIGYDPESGTTIVIWGNSSSNFAGSEAAVVMEIVRGESAAIAPTDLILRDEN
jgi:D-alanyl-D-alanine carboxypeptidase